MRINTVKIRETQKCFVADSWVWIGLSSVLRPRQHSIGYMGDGFYRSKDPTNSIKVLKEMLQKRKQTTKTTKYKYADTIMPTVGISTTSKLDVENDYRKIYKVLKIRECSWMWVHKQKSYQKAIILLINQEKQS